ncbi:GNAT family N-acetyltransferase [Histidinibacterium aquaticum]|uniref:GNAT family N-acetyltransferase n=1 Tax=Histidinibacterium aquaticum TaxID=2613962 RepID=A0A5J5GST3_9RHOB|nr:GNAT family N-acetyltransferase [Histidinibacterium aquaticum]KAA9010594.1 GNAT family N-acetyltransferase [Histidinibacterium aquaticum]
MTERPWLNPPPGPAAERAAGVTEAIPSLETRRLRLRAPRLDDWPVLEPIWTTEHGRHIGGPMSPEEAWLDFNQIVASWLLRGFGAFTIEDLETGRVLGIATLDHEWGDPEPEIGWLLIPEAEGRGFAVEAGRALISHARELLGGQDFVAYMDASHERSIRVAEALGGKLDEARHPEDKDVLVYRFEEEDA